MNPLAKAWWTAKGVGWDNLPRRLLQAVRIRSGQLRRKLAPERFSDAAFRAACPVAAADQGELWAERAKRFFPVSSAEALAAVADEPLWNDRVVSVCEKALAGEYLFFGHWYAKTGWPVDFNLDAVHGIRWPVGEHWLDTAHSGPPRDDIKLVWEPSRVSVAYFFARAFARSGDPRTGATSAWAPYSLPRRETMVFAATPTMQDDPRGGERALYQRVPFVQRGTS